jgi:hypothetical protein
VESPVAGGPRGGRERIMEFSTADVLSGERLEFAWRLYTEVFEELRSTAVQRHVMYRSEFDDVMADRRVLKYVAEEDHDRCGDGGALCGLATLTNDLTAAPLISPDYFERHYPERFRKRQIWYVGFVAAHPGGRRARVFQRIIEEMYKTASEHSGVVALDVCQHNEDVYGLPSAVEKILTRRFGDVNGQRLDAQSYWLYEFPAA